MEKKIKIDFRKLLVTDVEGNKIEIIDKEGNKIDVDWSKKIGNVIWNTTTDVLEAELAQRIAKEKVLELTKEEISIIRNNMEKGRVIACVKIAFENAVKEAEKMV